LSVVKDISASIDSYFIPETQINQDLIKLQIISVCMCVFDSKWNYCRYGI